MVAGIEVLYHWLIEICSLPSHFICFSLIFQRSIVVIREQKVETMEERHWLRGIQRFISFDDNTVSSKTLRKI